MFTLDSAIRTLKSRGHDVIVRDKIVTYISKSGSLACSAALDYLTNYHMYHVIYR